MLKGVDAFYLILYPYTLLFSGITVTSLYKKPESSILQSLEKSEATILTPNLPEKNIFFIPVSV